MAGTDIQLTSMEESAFIASLYQVVGGINNLLDPNGPFVSHTELDAKIALAQTSNNQPWPVIEGVINAGDLSIYRMERITYVRVSNLDNGVMNDLDTITGTSFGFGDVVVLLNKGFSQGFKTTRAGNIHANGGSFYCAAEGHCIALQNDGGSKWREIWRYPAEIYPALNPQDAIVASNVLTKREDTNLLYIQGQFTGEVLATVLVTITSISIGTVVELFVDKNDGGGAFMIATYTDATAFPAFAAPLLRNAVNALTPSTGFTAVLVGLNVKIMCPVGTGTAPNAAWQLYVTVSDASAIDVGNPLLPQGSRIFFGTTQNPAHTNGVNGTAQSDQVDTFNYGLDGEIIYLNNAMTGTKTLLMAAAFLQQFYLGAAQTVPVLYNANSGLWERITTVTTHEETFFPVYESAPNFYPMNGAYNGVPSVGQPTIGMYSIGGHGFLALLNGFEMGFTYGSKVRSGGVGTTFEVILDFAQDGVDVGNMLIHVGIGQWRVGEDINTVPTWVSRAVTMPGLSERVQSESFTVPTTAIHPGAMLAVFVFRNGSAAGDTSTSDMILSTVTLKYQVNQ